MPSHPASTSSLSCKRSKLTSSPDLSFARYNSRTLQATVRSSSRSLHLSPVNGIYHVKDRQKQAFWQNIQPRASSGYLARLDERSTTADRLVAHTKGEVLCFGRPCDKLAETPSFGIMLQSTEPDWKSSAVDSLVLWPRACHWKHRGGRYLQGIRDPDEVIVSERSLSPIASLLSCASCIWQQACKVHTNGMCSISLHRL